MGIRKFHATRVNDAGHIVVVLGIQYKRATQQVVTENVDCSCVKNVYAEQRVRIYKRNMQHLDLVVTIKNPSDEENFAVAEKMLLHRWKKQQCHMTLTAPQYMGDDFCQNIVETEADYIISHIDKFVDKYKKFKNK